LISSLFISNFLSHKRTELKFSKGVNVIVGPTDSGKSAIIKALKWVLTNRPMGDGFRSNWGGRTEVVVACKDAVVARAKDKGVNSYFLGEDLKLDALKGEVPQQIKQALNMTDFNLQTQFDAHFLLSASSGEVAQYFNKVAHLDKIDTGLQNIQRWLREVSRQLVYNEQALKANEERLASYSYLEELDAKLLVLEKNDRDRLDLTNDKRGIVAHIKALAVIEADIAEVDFLDELEEKVNDVLEIVQQQSTLKKELTALCLTTAVGKKLEVEIETTVIGLNKLEEQLHEELGSGSICPLCNSKIK
jgi:DNA repair protein SbcC/Rad50